MLCRLAQILKLKGRFLIHIIVQPVAVEQMGMGAPVHEGSSCGVIIQIIMGGHAGISILYRDPDDILHPGYRAHIPDVLS